ncbi:hypothetical protein ACNR9Z_001515 [Candidozyma auris]
MRSPTSPSEESAEQLSQTLSMLQFSRASGSVKERLTSKLLHNVTELNEYMFGRGLPSSELHTATKVHLLPQFNSVHGSFQAVLVTKLFSIPDTSGQSDSLDDPDPCWEPTPTFPVRESSYPFPSSLSAGQASSSPESAPSLTVSNKYTVNSRFALGIVIPFSQEQSVDDVLFQNWEVISHYLVILQKLVTKKLLSVIKSHRQRHVSLYSQQAHIISLRALTSGLGPSASGAKAIQPSPLQLQYPSAWSTPTV